MATETRVSTLNDLLLAINTLVIHLLQMRRTDKNLEEDLDGELVEAALSRVEAYVDRLERAVKLKETYGWAYGEKPEVAKWAYHISPSAFNTRSSQRSRSNPLDLAHLKAIRKVDWTQRMEPAESKRWLKISNDLREFVESSGPDDLPGRSASEGW